jgi:protein-tyrosine phosphatase
MHDDALSIRLASPAEARLALAILTDATLWLRSRGLPTWNPAQLPAAIAGVAERGELYLGWMADRPVGTVSIQWTDVLYWGEQPDDAGYIHKLAVARFASGQQIGAALLRWAEGYIALQGRTFARLDCQATNPVINRFYQGAGYELRGTVYVNELRLNCYEKALR